MEVLSGKSRAGRVSERCMCACTCIDFMVHTMCAHMICMFVCMLLVYARDMTWLCMCCAYTACVCVHVHTHSIILAYFISSVDNVKKQF